MRQHLTFDCNGTAMVGTLDTGSAGTGLLIVSGGNEIRMGAHRGMAMLAQDIAGHGFPVFRFDRRGVGDSDGENNGFLSSEPDIAAAIATFRAHAPGVRHIVAFGNCDAATALILHDLPVDALILANPWVVPTSDPLPPPAAIKARYAKRLSDPKAWAALVSGKLNIRAAIEGLARIAASADDELAHRVATAMRAQCLPTTIVLAERDNTALAFMDVWQSAAFAPLRERSDVRVIVLDSASHSFANETDYAALRAALLSALGHAGENHQIAC